MKIIPVVPAPPASEPRHWRTLDERAETPEARRAAHEEFEPGVVGAPEPSGVSRRGFLGVLGTGAALAATVACDQKGRGTVVPYTRRPPEVVPGVANFYASAFQEGRLAYPVLVKTREGRPIHISGNDEHPAFKGKTSPRALADVLRLYDPDRLRAPRSGGQNVSWSDAQAKVDAALRDAKSAAKPVLLLTGAAASPTRKALLADLKAAIPTLEHLTWEPAAGDAADEGARASYGAAVEIHPRLDAAKVIVSLGADFLNGDAPESVAAFATHRRGPEAGAMNRLWVFEGTLSITGTNADQRLPVRPSRVAAVAFALAKDLAAKGVPLPQGADLSAIPAGAPADSGIPADAWAHLVNDVSASGSSTVVLCGPEMPAEAHQAAHLLNAMLGSQCVRIRATEGLATTKDLDAAVKAMASGKYAAAILWDVNPAYAFRDATAWKAGFAKVPFRAWIGLAEDESAAQCGVLLPENHWLESWNDFAVEGTTVLQQPAIGAIYDTRQGEDVILAALKALGVSVPDSYHAYLQARWRKELHPAGSPVSFDRFFEASLHDGLLRGRSEAAPPAFSGGSVAAAARRAAESKADGFELVLFPGFATYDGRYANNGWLQECPDPVTKMTWSNPLLLSVADAKQLGVTDGDIVSVEAAGATLRLPVVLQPGQAAGVAALALGYGRTSGTVAAGVGVNAFPFMAPEPGSANLRRGVRVAKAGGSSDLARTQGHHRMEGRDLVRSFTVAEWATEAQTPRHDLELVSLYPDQQFPDHKWGMAIDLAACVGCSACVLACQSENNVAVVGPEQVVRGREMHWIRIDRYYEGELDNPRVVHQPVLCQHCDSAPCENVCPVNATNHSPDGLNQMAYNRCVGTRYCGNNCPYKVRRFNFLDYTSDKHEPESLVYNPEVTVRPRGVMEKCSFCVQRIQDVKIRAKGEKRAVRDGEVMPACAVACPADAIVFGDLKDPQSRVAALARSRRGYRLLEEVGARPAITYLADLKNPAMEGPR